MTRPLRLALAFPGDADDPLSWSGTPYGVSQGLESLGVEVVPLRATPGTAVERALGLTIGLRHLRQTEGADLRARAADAYGVSLATPSMARARSLMASVRARSADVDGMVQIGTGFALPPVAPIVTYEDMTIPQALQYPYKTWSRLDRAAIGRRIALQRSCYARAHSVCMTNSWAADSAWDDFAVAPQRCHVVGVGTHEELRNPTRNWSVPRFLFIGVDFERKNGYAVLKAFARVREVHPDARLDVVGGHPPMEQDGVTGHGFVRRHDAAGREQLRRLFDEATCFVMPSLLEPSAVVYTEALAAALPIIGTIKGGSADLIGDAGELVDPLSLDDLTDSMLRLADPGTAQALSERARKRAPDFTWTAVAGRLVRALGLRGGDRELSPYLPRLA